MPPPTSDLRSARGVSPQSSIPQRLGSSAPRGRPRLDARGWPVPACAPTNPMAPAPRSRETRSPCRSRACADGRPSYGPPPAPRPATGPRPRRWRRPSSRARSGRRYSTSSACISQRLRPARSRRTKSAEPKHAIRDPRTDATRSAICTNRRDGASCWIEVGSQTFQAVSVAPSQNSRRPSYRSISLADSRNDSQPGKSAGRYSVDAPPPGVVATRDRFLHSGLRHVHPPPCASGPRKDSCRFLRGHSVDSPATLSPTTRTPFAFAGTIPCPCIAPR